MNKKNATTEGESSDPDEVPELNDEWFDTADQYDGDKLIRRGRRRGANRLTRPQGVDAPDEPRHDEH